jgi:hypothetical protein
VTQQTVAPAAVAFTGGQYAAIRANLIGRMLTTVNRLWLGLGSWHKSDVPRFQRDALPVLAGTQQALGQLVAVHVSRQASVALDKPLAPPVLPPSLLTDVRQGVTLAEEYARPFEQVWWHLARRRPPDRRGPGPGPARVAAGHRHPGHGGPRRAGGDGGHRRDVVAQGAAGREDVPAVPGRFDAAVPRRRAQGTTSGCDCIGASRSTRRSPRTGSSTTNSSSTPTPPSRPRPGASSRPARSCGPCSQT